MHSYYKKDLDEDVVITLDARNPQAPHNKIRFDYTTGTYITQKLVETMIDHLEIESSCVHKDSDEAKKQVKVPEESVNGMMNIQLMILLVKCSESAFTIIL